MIPSVLGNGINWKLEPLLGDTSHPNYNSPVKFIKVLYLSWEHRHVENYFLTEYKQLAPCSIDGHKKHQSEMEKKIELGILCFMQSFGILTLITQKFVGLQSLEPECSLGTVNVPINYCVCSPHEDPGGGGVFFLPVAAAVC